MRTVVLEESHLIRLAQIPVNVANFPFLRSALGRRASCCGSVQPNLNPAKAAVAGLADDKLAKFKALLGADKIRIVYRLVGQTNDVTV